MNLKEALDFIDIGNNSILLTDENNNEYSYGELYYFERDKKNYNKLASFEVTNIDVDDDLVIFYLHN